MKVEFSCLALLWEAEGKVCPPSPREDKMRRWRTMTQDMTPTTAWPRCYPALAFSASHLQHVCYSSPNSLRQAAMTSWTWQRAKGFCKGINYKARQDTGSYFRRGETWAQAAGKIKRSAGWGRHTEWAKTVAQQQEPTELTWRPRVSRQCNKAAKVMQH